MIKRIFYTSLLFLVFSPPGLAATLTINNNLDIDIGLDVGGKFDPVFIQNSGASVSGFCGMSHQVVEAHTSRSGTVSTTPISAGLGCGVHIRVGDNIVIKGIQMWTPVVGPSSMKVDKNYCGGGQKTHFRAGDRNMCFVCSWGNFYATLDPC